MWANCGAILEDASNDLSAFGRRLSAALYDELLDLAGLTRFNESPLWKESLLR